MSATQKWLSAEWQQRCLDALKDTLDVNSDLKRDMVQFLFDEGFWDPARLEWSAAVTKFNACLRPDTRENFSNIQLWALIKRFNRLSWFFAMADDLGFEVRKKATEERRIEIVERLLTGIEQANKLSAQALAALQQLGAPVPASRLHPAVREGNANFAFSGADEEPTGSIGVPNV